MNYCCVSAQARISICAVGFNNEPIVWVWSPGVSSPPPAHSPQALLESAHLQFNSQSEPNTGAQNVLWHLHLTENEQIWTYFYIKMTHPIRSCSGWLFVRLIWWLVVVVWLGFFSVCRAKLMIQPQICVCACRQKVRCQFHQHLVSGQKWGGVFPFFVCRNETSFGPMKNLHTISWMYKQNETASCFRKI